MKLIVKFGFAAYSLLASYVFLFAQENYSYQLPPEEIAKAIRAPILPTVKISPQKDYMLIIDYGSGFTSIQSLSVREVGAAGLRINPKNLSNINTKFAKRIQLKSISTDSSTIAIRGLPKNSFTAFHTWSPDGSKIAFCRFTEKKVELWVIEVSTATASRVTDFSLNAIFWNPYIWLPDSKSLLCKVFNQNPNQSPNTALLPTGPIIRESREEKAQVRTYQNLLRDADDEVAFEYYTTSQLTEVRLDGSTKKIAEPGIILSASVSPNGKYILIERVHRPYSYLVTVFRFPTDVSIYDRGGRFVRQVADIPVRENIPLGREAVQPTARNFAWRPDKPATLYWTKAQDDGDPETEVEVRDLLYTLKAPFSDSPTELFKTGYRLRKVIWGNDTIAVAIETWWPDQKVIWTRVNPKKHKIEDSLLIFSSENRYTHPGNPESIYSTSGQELLYVQPDGTIFLLGEGASPEGDRPFVDKYNLYTKSRNRIWQSDVPYFEEAIQVMDSSVQCILIKRESKRENPNFYLHNVAQRQSEQITFFPNPNHHFQKIQHQKMHYTRKDGIKLIADLYLPTDYVPDTGPLPTVITAYPVDFKQKEAAEQMYGSPYKFVSYKDNGMLTVLAKQGYAVINASFPIIPNGSEEPNDTFVDQLIANAEAVILEGVRMGVVDSSRVAVSGHSYGAFMVANLLTHSNIFDAGIALSGAYNRTLTPFGFQREKRTYWEAPQLYNDISPFQHADKMKSALLLIHGEADSNSGTYPMQSERYFHALKGLGATVRYVLLPHEGHVYRTEESNLHVYWEICRWLNIHLKNQKSSDEQRRNSLLINTNSK